MDTGGSHHIDMKKSAGTKSFTQSVSFSASAHDLYEALMDSGMHSKFTGERARISRNVGGTVSAYSGYAVGVNLRLIPDRLIEQTWHASDWEEDETSVVCYRITPMEKGCRLTFTHQNIPLRFFTSVKQGWSDFYWKPLKSMLKAKL